MTTTAPISPCPECGGTRANIAPAGHPDLLECAMCGGIESAFVGVVPRANDIAELLPPPQDADDELLPPPPGEEMGDELSPAQAESALSTAISAIATTRAATSEVLPADFELPPAIRFVPNPELQIRAVEFATEISALQVTDNDSCQRMDGLLARARLHDQRIDDHFAEPVDFFFARHRALTTQRNEFHGSLPEMVKTGGRRIYLFNQEQERKAADERRLRQEEADRQAREVAEQEAAEARKAQAPAPLIAQLEEQARTATAPPVAATATAPRDTLKGSTVTETWKVRLANTRADASFLQPEKTADMSNDERASVLELLKGIVAGAAPMSLIRVDWTTANQLVKAHKGTLKIPGFTPYQDGGTRGKSTRGQMR
jgi:hypothetical protein